MKTPRNLLRRIQSNLLVIIGVVLLWRGLWVILDTLDYALFGGNDIVFAVVTIVAGLAMLYVHDHRYDDLDHF